MEFVGVSTNFSGCNLFSNGKDGNDNPVSDLERKMDTLRQGNCVILVLAKKNIAIMHG